MRTYAAIRADIPAAKDAREALFLMEPLLIAEKEAQRETRAPGCAAVGDWGRPGHEPVAFPQHLGLRYHLESELLVEADVLGPVGLQIRERSAVVHARREGGQHDSTDSTSLEVRVNRHGAQMP